MVGDNKILTVSYGTFSCTLEGFEDPFATMKDIAEYFRDLAADDRLFGAEPPQLDLDLLQSLAEKSVKNPVNAKVTDNSLVLRQSNGSDAPHAPVTPVAAATLAPLVLPVTATGMETVAEKLQRIRAVVSREATQDALFSEDQHVDEFAVEATAPTKTFEETSFNTATLVADEALDATPADEPIAVEPTEEVSVVEDAIEDVAEPVADDETSDVEAVEDTAHSALNDISEYDDEGDAFGDVDLAAITNAALADTADTPLVEEMDAASREEAAETAVDTVLGRTSDESAATPRRRIVVQKITRDDLKAARIEAEKNAAVKDLDYNNAEPKEEEPLESELPAEQEEALMRELAALQLDTTAEMASDDAPSVATHDKIEDADIMDAEIVTKSGLDADDALTNTLNDLIAKDEQETKMNERATARQARRERRDAIIDDDHDDLERLITTTTSRLDNDESSQRRASIAHLKAAVAATKADASLADAAQVQEARERDQYAEDLARVVRTERATRSVERNQTDRPAPLVLVSEQRIDRIETKPKSDLVAAEITTQEEADQPPQIDRAELDAQELEIDRPALDASNQTSFSDYAASANALALPDLLEAAAAFYTFIEGIEQFTRPMLMRKIASIDSGTGFSREAGLRSFGTLLREGKLVKDGNGKFVIAKSSRFTPEARYAGE